MNNVKQFIIQNASSILTGIGVAGVITTTGLAIKATPKALSNVLDYEATQEYKPSTFVEKVKVSWRYYVPTVVSGGVTIGSIIYAKRLDAKKIAAFASIAAASSKTIKLLESKIVEEYSESKLKKVKEKMNADRINDNPPSKRNTVTNKKRPQQDGDTLFYDVRSGRYFYSDIEYLRKKLNDVADLIRLQNEDICMNDIYYEIGLPGTEDGNILGVPSSSKTLTYSLTAHLSKDKNDEYEGIPCIALEIDNVTQLWGS